VFYSILFICALEVRVAREDSDDDAVPPVCARV
jgi:hypothetical protein